MGKSRGLFYCNVRLDLRDRSNSIRAFDFTFTTTSTECVAQSDNLRCRFDSLAYCVYLLCVGVSPCHGKSFEIRKQKKGQVELKQFLFRKRRRIMEKKRKKYDTNPLPEDVAREAEEAFGQPQPQEQEPVYFTPQPQSLNENPYSEAPTRNYKEKFEEPYRSVFAQPNVENFDGNLPLTAKQESAKTQKYMVEKLPLTSRSVEGINLPENIVMIAPYLPVMIGAVVAVIWLLVIPRHETRIRFHAAQGLALHIAAFAIGFILNNIIGSIIGNGVPGSIFGAVSVAFFIFSMIRVWAGEPHHIEKLDDATNWLNEKIGTRK